MALDRACAAYEQPTEPIHCPNLGTRGKEEQRAAKGDMEKNCRLGKAEDGFCHWSIAVTAARGRAGWSQWPYSPRGNLENKSVSQVRFPVSPRPYWPGKSIYRSDYKVVFLSRLLLSLQAT